MSTTSQPKPNTELILVADIGNSNIVWGLYDGSSWLHVWRNETNRSRPYESYGMELLDFFLEHQVSPASIRHAVVSSVVPELNTTIQHVLSSLVSPSDTIWLGPSIYHKLPIKLNNPIEIGTDLVANALAAHHLFKEECLVVDFGTALTFTVISKTPEILGVSIAPGLKTAVKALFLNTSKLPEVPLELPSSVIGKGTVHAIQAGVLWGYVGLVSTFIDLVKNELGSPNLKIVATGGLSSVLKPLHPRFDAIEPNLTLNGLIWVKHHVGN